MTAPVIEDRELAVDDPVDPDMPLERVPPVRRDVPQLRGSTRRPPVVTAALAVLAMVLAGVAAAAAPDPPLLWELADGELLADGSPLGVGASPPADTELVAGADGAVLTSRAARMELGAGTAIRLQLSDRLGARTVALGEGGSLVVNVEVALTVDATEVSATGIGGAFRVERDATPRVASYDATLGIAGDTQVSMARFQQVPLGASQAEVGPVLLDPDDPWDRRHGQMALDTDEQLATIAAGLEASYGTESQTPGFYRDFVGVTDGLVEALPQLATIRDGGRFGPPAPTLVAATTVTALVEATARPLESLVDEVRDERAAGGTWGVILAQDRLDAAAVSEVAAEALRRRTEQGEDAEPVIRPEPVAPEPPTEPEPSPAPSPATDEDPEEPEQPDEPEGPDEPDEPDEPEDPEQGPVGDALDDVGELLEPEDGLFGPPADAAEDAVTGLLEPLGAGDGPVGDLLGTPAVVPDLLRRIVAVLGLARVG